MSNGVLYVEIMPSTKGIGKAVEGDLNKQFKGAEKTGEGFFSKVGTWAKRGALAIGGMVAAVGALAIGGGISRALNIEDAQAKLKGLGHDTKAVEAIMSDALASVKGTAFGLDAAASTAAAAVASGIQPGKELEGYLRLTADAATIAGVSMEEMGSIMNKVQAKGKVQMEDLNRLTERGIPIMQMLADEYGVTAEEMSAMVSRGEVDAERFRAALEKNVGGAALASGETTRGAFANMRAALSRLGVVFLGDGLSWAKTFFNEMTVIFDGIAERIGPWVERIQEKLGGMFQLDGMGDGFLDWLDGFIDAVANGPIPQLISALAPIFPVLGEAVKLIGSALGEAFKELGEALAPHLPEIAQALADAVIQLAPALADLLVAIVPIIPALAEGIAQFAPFAADILELLIPALKWLVENMESGLNAFSALADLLSGDSSFNEFAVKVLAGSESLKGFYQFVNDTKTSIVNFLVETMARFIGWVVGIRNTFVTVTTFFSNLWTNISTAFRTGVNTAVSFVQSLPGRIMSALSGAGSWLVSVGRDLIQGLINGVSSMVQSAVNAVKDVGGQMLSGVKSFLGIKSPSRVFRDEVGKMVGLGLLAGIEDQAIQGRIDTAVNHMVSVPDDARSSGFPAFVTLVDDDGAIFTRLRVVADQRIDTYVTQVDAVARQA